MDPDIQRFTHGYDDQYRSAEISNLQRAVDLQFPRLSALAFHSGLINPQANFTAADTSVEEHVVSEASAQSIFAANFARIIMLRNSRSISMTMTLDETLEMQAAYLLAFKTLELMTLNYVVDLLERANFDYYLGEDKKNRDAYECKHEHELRTIRYRNMRAAGLAFVTSVTNLFTVFAYVLCHAETLYGTSEPHTDYDQWHHFVLGTNSILSNQCKLAMLYAWQLHGFFESPYATSTYFQSRFPQQFTAFAQNVLFHIIGKLLMANTPPSHTQQIRYHIARLADRSSYARDYEITMLGTPVSAAWRGSFGSHLESLSFNVPDLSSSSFSLTTTVSNLPALRVNRRYYEPPDVQRAPYISVFMPDKEYVTHSRIALYKYYSTPEGHRVHEAIAPQDFEQTLIRELTVLTQTFFYETVDIALLGAPDYDPLKRQYDAIAKANVPLIRDPTAVQQPIITPRRFRRLGNMTKLMKLWMPCMVGRAYVYTTAPPPEILLSTEEVLLSESSSSSSSSPSSEDYSQSATEEESPESYTQYTPEYELSPQPPAYSPVTPAYFDSPPPPQSMDEFQQWIGLSPQNYDDAYYSSLSTPPPVTDGVLYDEESFNRVQYDNADSYAQNTQGDVDGYDYYGEDDAWWNR